MGFSSYSDSIRFEENISEYQRVKNPMNMVWKIDFVIEVRNSEIQR